MFPVPSRFSERFAARFLQCRTDLSRGGWPTLSGIAGEVPAGVRARERRRREEAPMTLMKRMQSDLDWPTWMTRRFGPDFFVDLFEAPPMKIEEFERDGELVIRAEMPGIDPDEDVELTVDDHRLHLKVERRTETEEDDEVTGFRSEFHYGSFERTMMLPSGATEDDVTAHYEDGILEVHVPIREDVETTKHIPVTRAA
jgi:HSP20 family protein